MTDQLRHVPDRFDLRVLVLTAIDSSTINNV